MSAGSRPFAECVLTLPRERLHAEHFWCGLRNEIVDVEAGRDLRIVAVDDEAGRTVDESPQLDGDELRILIQSMARAVDGHLLDEPRQDADGTVRVCERGPVAEPGQRRRSAHGNGPAGASIVKNLNADCKKRRSLACRERLSP